MRKIRLDRGLTQAQVAQELGADEDTINTWEKNKKHPSLPFIPQIIRFLGYTPFQTEEGFPERLRRCRKILGLSQQEVAAMLDIDESNLAKIERGEREPGEQIVNKLESFMRSIS